MAEFKLGRIKFVYQGTWTASGHSYSVDDVVTNGGKTYICVISHTSSSTFAADLAGIPGVTKWNLIADGSTWRNTWAATTYYNLGDIVLWGGTVYICKTAHTSQTYLEDDQSKWDQFSAGFKWLGAWTTSTRYKVRDLIYYGGSTYVCNTQHTSASTASSGLENDLSKWDIFNQSVTYLGDWSGSSVRYKLNDVVKFGADLWICTAYHTSTGVSIDTGNFAIFVNGFQFEGSWSAATEYQAGDVVTYGGYTYTAVQNSGASAPKTPSTQASYWKVFTSGLVYSGEWDTGTSYKIGNVVTRGAYTYVAKADNSASTPPSSNWGQLSSGIRWNSASNTTYTNVASSNVSSSGTGNPTFDVTRTGTTYTAIIHSGSAGAAYAVNDTLKVLGSDLGGSSPGNDLVVKVATITGGGATGPIDTVTVSTGYAATWKTGITYVIGDAIYYGNSSYICISAHIASTGVNDPISDDGTYWNILASGADSGALTTQGDMVYYGANGPVRLPIGTDGQVLRVDGDKPAWKYYGELQNVVYVAPTGVDSSGNGQGLTLDKPWLTLLYACRQVEEGYLNTNAGLLLTANKQFMMKEVNNFILFNYSFFVTGTSSSGNTFVLGGDGSTSQATTANMYYGMPITFTATTGGVTIGTVYYVNTIPTSTTFTISDAYQSAQTRAISPNSSTYGSAIFNYTQSKAERDTGTVIDGVVFDLTHGGNLYSVTATQAYFKTLTSFTSTGTTQQSPVFAASLTYLKDTLFPAVMTNSAPDDSYQTINGISSTSQAIQNITVVSTSALEADVLATAQSLLGIVTGALSAGTYGNIPQLVRPHTTIYLKTGTYNEYGPIVIPLDTAIVGDELRSTIVQVAKPQSYLGTDKPKTTSAIRRIQQLLPAIVNNVPVRTTTGVTATQQYINGSAQTLATTTQSIVDNKATIQSILANGLTALPGYATVTVTTSAASYTVTGTGSQTLSTPTGFGTTLTDTAYSVSGLGISGITGNVTGATTGYNSAVTNINANILFLQREIAAYLEGYTGSGFSWTALTTGQKSQTLRDIAFLLQSVKYDLTYGGNTQSQIDGLAYWSLTNNTLTSAAIIAGTTAALTRLQTIIPFIINGTTAGWTKTAANTGTQTLSVVGTFTNAGLYAQALIKNVINWIDGTNSPVSGGALSTGAGLPGTVLPALSWESTANLTAFSTIQSQRTYIQTQIRTFVGVQYPTVVASLDLTYRDAGTIIDALSYDMLLGTNYFSIVAGRAFYRANTSAQTLIGSKELQATQDSIDYISYLLGGIASNLETLPATVGDLGNKSAVNLVVNNTKIIQDMFSAGGVITGPTNPNYPNGLSYAPAISTPTVTGYNSSYLAGFGDGRALVQANYQFIKDEIVAFLNTDGNLTGTAQWSAYSSTYQAETKRDLGFILDAICYDMTYGCNTQSVILGSSYYSLNTAQLVSPYLLGVLESLGRLSTVLGQIVQKTSVTRSAGNTTTQYTTGTAGTAAAAAFAQARIADITYWINNGIADTTTATFTGYIIGTTLTVSSVTGTIKIGQVVINDDPLYGAVEPGTYITAGSGTSWTVSVSQTANVVTRSTMTITPIESGAYALASTANKASYDAIQARATEIANDAQSWVTRFYQNESPILSLTNRDAGYVVSAMAYDVLFNSNFQSIQCGRSYNRLVTSVVNLHTNLADSTYGALGFIGERVKIIAANGSVVQTQTVVDEMIAQIFGQPTTTATFNGTITGTQLVVNSAVTGTIAIGMQLSGTGIATGTSIVSGSGTNWLLNYNQSAASTTTSIISVTTSVTLNGNSYSNVLTAGTTNGFVPGLTITLTGTTIGNLTAGVYYIKQVLSSTQFTISQSYLGSVFTITNTAQGAMTAVVYGIYGGLGLTTDITASGTTIPVSTVTTSTNLITVASNNGMLVDMPIIFTGLPANITTTATTISSNSITLGATVSSLGVVVGQKVWFTGFTPQATTTQSSIVANQVYYVKTASASVITIAATLGGTALTLTDATGLTLTATFNAAGGLVNGAQYWINSVTAGTYPAAGTTITVTESYKSGTDFAITNTVGSLIATCTAGMPTNQGINDKITNGTIQPWNNAFGTYGSATGYNNTLTTIQGAELIRANKTFLATEAVEYVRSVFSANVTTTANTGTITCGTPHGLSVGDPVVFSASPVTTDITVTAVSGNNITVSSTTGIVANTIITFSGNLGNLQAGVTYYILTASNTTITVSNAPNGQAFAAGSASGSVTGTVRQYMFDLSITAGTVYWVLTTPTSSTLTLTLTAPGKGTQAVKTLTGSNGQMTVTYYIRTAQAIRDASYHIDGLVYDLGLTGNYKSTRSARLYLSAQAGATTTDLFHARNGSGIRNMTLNGMTGAMTLPNALGTKRPTAGSYTSLDAGFGPNDSNAWISYRSPYTQNLTLFGSGCSGMKIDAALHSGGNKSIVANDYTTIISDGFGVWCTGSGALTELVSVFAYYSYAGYMAEYGGRIRATNGNSSYGTYGVIAEGIDSYETPIYGRLNNRASSAYITNVVTDGTDEILRLEFQNAGSAYTNANPSVSGAGYNIVTIGDEFRDAAVFETRLVDLNNGQGTGGSNYLTASNVAQTGEVGSVTIANSDIQLSSAYVGMRIQLIAGTGVGQYANIIGYAQSNKLANVVRPSFATLTITTNSTTVFTVASTATMYVGMPIYMGAAIGGLSLSAGVYSPTVYYVSTTSFSSTQFRLATTYANAIGGTNITLNATSATPAVTTASIIVGYTLTVGTLVSGTVYPGMLLTGGSILPNTFVVANISGSGNGSTWSVSVSQNLASTALTGTVAVPLYEAGWDHVVPGTTIQPLLDATSGYIIEPALSYTAPGFTSTGITMTAAATTTWAAVAYGQGTFVATSNATGVASTATTTDGTTWAAGGALPTDASSKWSSLTYGGGQNATATAVVGGVGGSGAVLKAVIGTGNTSGQIISITVVSGGYNYVTPPTIVITDATGAGATATARVLNGSIQAVDMIITGSLYANPIITAVTSSLSSITATTWGSGYYSAPQVTIAPPVTATGWSSGGAATSGTYYSAVDTTVSPNVTNYYLAGGSGNFSSTKPTFTNAIYGKSGYGASGSGASGTYGVALTYVGTLAVASANTNTNFAGYGVISYTVSQTGYGYATTPTVTVTDTNAAFVAISTATNSAAYSTDQGTTWTATAGNTGKTNLVQVAYGNNLYLAVGGTSSGVAVSFAPSGVSAIGSTTWSDQSSYITTNSAGYKAIAYGAGVFCAIGGTVSSFTAADPTKWYAGATLPSKTWVGVTYGNGRFVALASDGTVYYTTNWQTKSWTTTPSNAANNTWIQAPTCAGTTTSILRSDLAWTKIKYGQGVFLAIATGSIFATSSDGVDWKIQGASSSSNWLGVAFGNPINATLGHIPTWVAVSNTSGKIATRIATGATAKARAKVVNNQISEVRMIEPGSGYPRGIVTATSTTSTGTITVNDITNLTANQPIVFSASSGNIVAGTYYFVKGTPTSTSGLAGTIQISTTSGGSVFALTASTPTSMTYFAGPIITQTDPNKVNTAPLVSRIGNGALGNPSFAHRGIANTTATASYEGDGYADLYQVGTYVNVTGLYQIPTAGCNVVFSSITGTSRWYKLVSVTNVLGVAGNYTATFQINPGLSTLLAPAHNDLITTNLAYSNVRLTGHDFLYIGTGGFSATNYPYVDATRAVSANQQLFVGGGRVFFTSTDQDGNFNVGNLFGVQQSTGTATLNASAFNLSGLQSLTLGSVSLGVGSATIYQFSTDPYFTANSDGVVPTQKAIKAFITAQIGGGQSSLNVNTITSGQIYIAGNTISNTNNAQIYVSSKMIFTGGIDGAPVALAYFGQR